VGHGLPVLVAGLLLAAAVAASLTAGRLRFPSLVLFLGLGMAVGSDGAGWVAFGDYGVARDAGMLALAVILFDGGLSAGLEELRPVLRSALRLAVVATVVAAALAGLTVALVLRLPLPQGLLLGAILASTDSAAIFALVRGTSLRRRIARTLEGESGFNDPVAVLLVLGLIGWMVHPGWGVWNLAELLVAQLLGGLLVGIVVGRSAVYALERVPLPAAGLYPVSSLAAAALAYGGADALGGSGLLAVYLAGLLLADAPIQARQTIAVFHEGAGWIAQIGLFLMLGLLVSPAHLPAVATAGIVLAVIVLIARPAAALLATARDPLSLPERFIIGWAGLRGAVPVVLATLPVTAGVARGTELFNIVFIVVIATTLVQGVTLEPLARALRVTSREPARPRELADRGTIRRLGAEIVEYPVSPIDGVVGRQVGDLGLPPEATVNVIVRGTQAIPPTGTVRIRAGDRLHLLVRREVAGDVAVLVSRWEAGDAARWT
jgi:cell volume regulation protein A